MQIATIDFETYYDKDYSLSKMTTEAYIRHPGFQIIGVGIKIGEHETDWFSGDHASIKKFLRGMDFSDKAILCHNTVFDGAILSWHFGVKPKLWLDTLSMARPSHNVTVGGSLAKLAAYYGLGEKGTEVVLALGKRREDFSPEELSRYGAYCCNDVELTYSLFKKLAPGFPGSELMVIDQAIRMFTEPMIELDHGLLTEHLLSVKRKKQDLLDTLKGSFVYDETFGAETTADKLMSNPKFALLLRSAGVEPPTKISLRTGKSTFAFGKTDPGFTALLEHPDPYVQALVSARLGMRSTLEETRTTALMGVASRGRLPIMLTYYAAHTGRYGGADGLNLQNLPSRTNNTIRRALCAPKGYEITACDASQIEARLVAWLAGQKDLVQAFSEGRDVYSEFASLVYDRPITKADKAERFLGKTCILGLGYGMGAEKLYASLQLGARQQGIALEIDDVECKRIVQIYRQRNHKIATFWNRCKAAIADMVYKREGQLHQSILPYSEAGITLPNTLKLIYPMLREHDGQYQYINDQRTYLKAVKEKLAGVAPADGFSWTRIYGGKLTENIVQALAALAIREMMVAAKRKGLRVVFQVHDELVIVSEESRAEAEEQMLIEVMSTPPVWAPDLPVACESGRAKNYGET